MPILPRIPPGRPLPSRRFHVTPLSSDRYRPLPGPPLEKNHGCRCACQSDAKTMLGLCGSKTMSMPPVFSSFDRTFVHVLPPSVVRRFHVPDLDRTHDLAPPREPRSHFLDRQS